MNVESRLAHDAPIDRDTTPCRHPQSRRHTRRRIVAQALIVVPIGVTYFVVRAFNDTETPRRRNLEQRVTGPGL